MKRRTLFISRLAIILSLTLIIQTLGLPQPITGPLINAMLILTASFLGAIAGVILGCLTPIVALTRGQLPTVLAPMVPFIAAGNAALVIIFYFINYHFKTKLKLMERIKPYVAITCAAVAKFLLLYFAVRLILPTMLDIHLPDKIIIIMSTPQLFTALIGGALALLFLKILKKEGVFFSEGNGN